MDEVDDDFVDIERHQEELSRLFFKWSDLISSDSPEFPHFLEFYDRYVHHATDVTNKRRKTNDTTSNSKHSELPFSIKLDTDRIHKRSRIQKKQIDTLVECIHLYEDFRQKKSFSRLVQLESGRKSLPIYNFKDQMVNTVRNNQVVIVAGDTGCGKSTQLPQYLMEDGFHKIVCTQPRRISAQSLARRLSLETMNEYGSKIGYQIRFESMRTKRTKILFVTEGILLRILIGDRLLKQFDVVILDEVHERHLYGDFLLGIMKLILPQRPELKLILMSATINVDMFSNYFEGAPVFHIPGRLHRIDVEYIPLDEPKRGKRGEASDEALLSLKRDENQMIRVGSRQQLDPAPYVDILQRIDDEVSPRERGDMLVFVSGVAEIDLVTDALSAYARKTRRWIVLPLHSQLSVEDQDKVFDIPPQDVRKVIVSTNIAETSITIDGVRFVVDSGKVKEMTHDPITKMMSLQEYWVSKASAEQRKGRSGRTGPGVTFRLYSRTEYDHFLPYNTPEILRTPLDSLALQIKALGLGDPRQFPFIELPSTSTVDAAVRQLKTLSALRSDEQESLTALGSVLSMMPLDVPVGKLLLFGTIFENVDPVLTIAASISVQSPLLSVANSPENVVKRRNALLDEDGDPFVLLNVFDSWIRVKASGRENSRSWCTSLRIEEERLYQIAKLKQQLKGILQDVGLIRERGSGERMGSRRWARSQADRTERERRKRELRLLHMEKSRTAGKRILRLDGNVDAEQKEGNGVDIHHMDFLMTCDFDEFVRAGKERMTTSIGEKNLLKCILFSGFYPNIAFADELPHAAASSDAVFHTPAKSFVHLHPTSILSSSGCAARQGELLCYMKLLETRRPYLTNVFRAPAAHLLLLVGRVLDTNEDCTKIIVDNWLELRFSKAEVAQTLVDVIAQLRLQIESILERKLRRISRGRFEESGRMSSLCSESESLPPFIRRVCDLFSKHSIPSGDVDIGVKLAQFLESPVQCTVHRPTSHQIVSSFFGADDVESFHSDGLSLVHHLELSLSGLSDSFDNLKKGVKVMPFLRYNSVKTVRAAADTLAVVREEQSEKFDQKTLDHDNRSVKEEEIPVENRLEESESSRQSLLWMCDLCGKNFEYSEHERIEHLSNCDGKARRNAQQPRKLLNPTVNEETIKFRNRKERS